jgi:hypothetical protein
MKRRDEFLKTHRDGSVLDTDKSVWAQGRMSWMLLTMYNTVEPRAEWLEWAQRGLEFLDRHCFDADGRMFFHVTRDPKTTQFRADLFTPFDETDAAWKRKLLLHHRSQEHCNRKLRDHGFDDRILAVNRRLAAELGCNAPYAEAFQLE